MTATYWAGVCELLMCQKFIKLKQVRNKYIVFLFTLFL